MKKNLIKNIQSAIFEVPLAEVLTDAKHGDHTHFELIIVAVELEDGSRGEGYTYTGGRGGRAIKAMIDVDLAPALIGRDGTAIEQLFEVMEYHIHYVGRGGDLLICYLGH